ncbi:unnamed protein product [Sphagnum balticum]
MRRYAPLPLPHSVARWLAGTSAFLLGGPDGGFLSLDLCEAAGGICVWVTFQILAPDVVQIHQQKLWLWWSFGGSSSSIS